MTLIGSVLLTIPFFFRSVHEESQVAPFALSDRIIESERHLDTLSISVYFYC
jgi:hypothetical protein